MYVVGRQRRYIEDCPSEHESAAKRIDTIAGSLVAIRRNACAFGQAAPFGSTHGQSGPHSILTARTCKLVASFSDHQFSHHVQLEEGHHLQVCYDPKGKTDSFL